ncbi:MAG: hypothetical protein AAFV88_00440 [Planctomycetota bacterium]
MTPISLLRLEELETRRMLSADVSINTSWAEVNINNRSSWVAAIGSPVPVGPGVSDATAEILSQRIRVEVADTVERLTPASIDSVIARIGDETISFPPVIQTTVESRTSPNGEISVPVSFADRFRGFSQLAALGANPSFEPSVVFSQSQQAQLIDGLRELFSLTEILGAVIPMNQGTSPATATKHADAIREQVTQFGADSLESLIHDINPLPHRMTVTPQDQEFEARRIDTPAPDNIPEEISPLIQLLRGEPRTAQEDNDDSQTPALTLQRMSFPIDSWVGDKNPTGVETLARALFELHVSLGEPLGDFANLPGIDDFEFDSFVQSGGLITDARARYLAGMTLLTAATIVAGHVIRSERRESHVAEIADSQEVDVFDETVRHDIPNRACWG